MDWILRSPKGEVGEPGTRITGVTNSYSIAHAVPLGILVSLFASPSVTTCMYMLSSYTVLWLTSIQDTCPPGAHGSGPLISPSVEVRVRPQTAIRWNDSQLCQWLTLETHDAVRTEGEERFASQHGGNGDDPRPSNVSALVILLLSYSRSMYRESPRTKWM